ncbi:MAG: hypothetical protein P4M14_12660 [Gammaproteobacteria bacterium]|nr:hypothetical protein [Gammaproteobacteria bacterium]
MTKLTTTEKNHNQMTIENLFTLIDDLPVGYNKLLLQQLILKFAETNDVTLINLLEAEEISLIAIMKQAAKLDLAAAKDQAQLQASLVAWKDTLHHAVYGKGASVALHAAQPKSMAASLIQSGSVPEAQWGSDLDILQCLGKSITQPDKIEKAGDYILSPVSLTDSPEAIKHVLQKALASIQQNKISDAVTLAIPVNCGNSHWRLVKVTVVPKDKSAEVELWDSMGGSVDTLKNSVAYRNLQTAVNAVAGKVFPVKATREGIQKNGHSCMDYCIREALIGVGEINDIVSCAANESRELRLAIIKSIAAAHPALGEAVANKLVSDGKVIRNPGFVAGAEVPNNDEVLTVEDAKVFDDMKKNGVDGDLRAPFDTILANKLNNAYKDTKTDEKVLFERALKQTMRECGLFAKKKTAAPSSGAATDEVPVDEASSGKKPSP